MSYYTSTLCPRPLYRQYLICFMLVFGRGCACVDFQCSYCSESACSCMDQWMVGVTVVVGKPNMEESARTAS